MIRIIVIFLFFSLQLNSQPKAFSKSNVLFLVNEIRAEGCVCGDRYMPPVGQVQWHDKLVSSALIQAKMMKKHNFFGHIGPDGLDVADKMDIVKYRWHFAGENLGEGQESFAEVLEDWLNSTTHCTLLMDQNMKDLGLVKYDRYWVMHLGKQLPPGARRTKKTYVEK